MTTSARSSTRFASSTVSYKRTLGVYASTGRTGSTFLHHLFGRAHIAGSLHSGVWKRVDSTLPSTEEIAAAYVSSMRAAFPDASVYVEANPRFVERVAWPHAVADPIEILDLLEAQGVIVRCLVMVRDPRSWAISIKHRWRESGRDPQVLGDPRAAHVGVPMSEENVRKMYGVPPGMAKPQGFDTICATWLLRNRYLEKLLGDERCLLVPFEDLFGSGVSDEAFVGQVQQIHGHLQLPAYTWLDELVASRHRPTNPTSKAEGLSDDELDRLREICGEEAARFGYQL